MTGTIDLISKNLTKKKHQAKDTLNKVRITFLSFYSILKQFMHFTKTVDELLKENNRLVKILMKIKFTTKKI